MVGKYYAEDKMKTIMKEKDIVIFGARFMALGVAACLMGTPY